MRPFQFYTGILLSALLFLSGCAAGTNAAPKGVLFDTHTTRFDVLSAELGGDGGSLGGAVDIVGPDSATAVYIDAADAIEVKVDYRLVREKGNLIVSYIASGQAAQVIADTSGQDGASLDGTALLTLQKGPGKIVFSGADTKYEFTLSLHGINSEQVSYFDMKPPQ